MATINIINYSSIVNIPQRVIDFADNVMVDEGRFYSMVGVSSIYGGMGIIRNIPIYLINEKDMKKYDKHFQCNKDEEYEKDFNDFKKEKQRIDDAIFPGLETFGVYLRENEQPVIKMCLERILHYSRCKNVNDDNFKYLFTKVMIHEFKHARFDALNQNAQCQYNEFCRWMEESLANLYTLYTIEGFIKKNRQYLDFLNYARNFMRFQPFEYALGLKLFDERIGKIAYKWALHKTILCQNSKSNPKLPEINAWMGYVLRNFRNIQKSAIYPLYNRLFANLARNTSGYSVQSSIKKRQTAVFVSMP